MKFILLLFLPLLAFANNAYYTPSGNPQQSSTLSSAPIRNEFVSIQNGFNKLPDLTALPSNEFVLVNSAGNGLVATSSSTALGFLSSNLANLATITSGALGESILATSTGFTFNLPMGGHKVTELAAGTTSGDAARYDELTSGLAGKATTGANTDITSLASPSIAGASATTQSALDNSTKVATTAYVNSSIAAIAGSSSNLSISTTGATANVFVSSNSTVLKGPAGYITVSGNSFTINTATSGVVNGIDIGSMSSGSVFYAVWMIYNPTIPAVAGLVSLSPTLPTLPSGYTYKSRIGWIVTQPASALPMPTLQLGNTVIYKATATIGPPFMVTNGSSGGYTAIALSTFVPPTASKIRVTISPQTSGVTAGIAPNQFYGSYISSAPPLLQIAAPNGNAGATLSGDILIESTNIYYSASNITNIICNGWTDNL